MEFSDILESEHSPCCLLQDRELALVEDLQIILNQGDFSSFQNFKEYWKANNLSLIHHSLNPKENKSEFYQIIWGILFNYMKHPDFEIKALYVLYTLYFTQNSKKININIDIKTANLLIEISKRDKISHEMISQLAKGDAFSLGALVGLKTILLNKRGLPVKRDLSKISTLNSEMEISLEIPMFDCEEANNLSMQYSYSKQNIIQLISDYPQYFKNESLPENLLASHFSPNNLQMLSLATPTFPIIIDSKLKSLSKDT
ncbi:unnamed protein product [Blepharisma stoltei]|uniref:Uncharacterized protein n=1 Tax=Blepharisma stoltei TaxID=1481888 RepID=A0AAU9JNE2_9CILI|nr:unnamed protein product [Blepharisma stoltei]